MFKGIITALITPFNEDDIDWPAFERLVEWQIEQGVHGLVPCGTTGESPTLSHEEHNQVIKRCVEVADGRIPVIAGTGSNSTREAVDFTRYAKDAGADAALVVTPYYNKPTQEGLYQHFKTLHDSAELPILIYNIPGRSVIDMQNATMARLAALPRIIGVKDATNDLGRPIEMRRDIGPDFTLLSGEDGTFAAFLAQGGEGIISVVANVAPALMAEFYNSWVTADLGNFANCRDRLMPLADALFTETSPAPVKYAAEILGLCRADLRLPLVPPGQNTRSAVEDALKQAGLTAPLHKAASA